MLSQLHHFKIVLTNQVGVILPHLGDGGVEYVHILFKRELGLDLLACWRRYLAAHMIERLVHLLVLSNFPRVDNVGNHIGLHCKWLSIEVQSLLQLIIDLILEGS